MTFEIRVLPAAAVRPLRLSVLRSDGRPEDVVWPGDDDPAARHLGAFAAGKLVGIASIRPAPHPSDPRPDDWQLRGMATRSEVRGQGAGKAVLSACLAHAAGEGGRRLWCNARTSAAGFYERAGFSKVGAEFDVPAIGPHVVMELALRS